MCWWKWRTNLLHKLPAMWGRGRRLRQRCWLCWQFKMWPGQWFWWQLWYFPRIFVGWRLLLWPKQPIRLVISKHLINISIPWLEKNSKKQLLNEFFEKKNTFYACKNMSVENSEVLGKKIKMRLVKIAGPRLMQIHLLRNSTSVKFEKKNSLIYSTT